MFPQWSALSELVSEWLRAPLTDARQRRKTWKIVLSEALAVLTWLRAVTALTGQYERGHKNKTGTD